MHNFGLPKKLNESWIDTGSLSASLNVLSVTLCAHVQSTLYTNALLETITPLSSWLGFVFIQYTRSQNNDGSCTYEAKCSLQSFLPANARMMSTSNFQVQHRFNIIPDKVDKYALNAHTHTHTHTHTQIYNNLPIDEVLSNLQLTIVYHTYNHYLIEFLVKLSSADL